MENVEKGVESAQAIIVAAFLIGVGILVLSALLNGLIFSQDLASRDDGAEERSVIEFSQDAEEAVSTAMTGNRTTPDDAEDEFDDFMNLYEEGLIQRYTSRQRAVSIEPTNFTDLSTGDGTLAWAIGQRCDVDDATTNCDFVNATGDANWQVVEKSGGGVFAGDSPYKLEFSVSRPSSGDVFVVNATDTGGFSVPPPLSSDGWNMTVDNSDIEFSEVGGGSSSYSWSDIDGDRARIEVMNETIDGEKNVGGTVDTQSGALDSNIVQVVFQGGDAVNGTYDIRIDAGVSESDINGPCDTTPDVCELTEDGDDRDLYSVGVVHEVSGIEASYVDLDISHTTEIDHTLEQKDMILEDR
jgi:hypothetical protein